MGAAQTGGVTLPALVEERELAVLHDGDRRLLDDLAVAGEMIDDRGLEFAEALLHERRQQDERAGVSPDDRLERALSALSSIRTLTKGCR